MKKTTRVLLATGATLAVLVGSGATAYAAHYQDRALPGSSVSGQGVSGLTRAELATVPAGDCPGCAPTTAGNDPNGHILNTRAEGEKTFSPIKDGL